MEADIESFEAAALVAFIDENWTAFVAACSDNGIDEGDAEAVLQKLQRKARMS